VSDLRYTPGMPGIIGSKGPPYTGFQTLAGAPDQSQKTPVLQRRRSKSEDFLDDPIPGFSSLTPFRSPSAHPFLPPQIQRKKTPKAASPLTRNRGVRTVLKNPSFPYSDLVQKKASQIGLIKSSQASRAERGTGSGILIAPNIVLASKHAMTDLRQRVEFTDFSGPADVVCAYEGQVHAPDSPLAKSLGLHFTHDTDLVLIELEKKPGDFPSEFTPVQVPKDGQPHTLIHFGFKLGQGLKISVADTRTVALGQMIKKDRSLSNEVVTWSDRATVGVVRQQESRLSEAGDRQVVVEVESKGGTHQFLATETSCDKHFKNGKISSATLRIERAMLMGHDHVIVGHNSGEGSSGGVYFTPEGDLFAVQRGRLLQELFADAKDAHFENHLAIFPWQPPKINFFEPYLRLEGKGAQSIVPHLRFDMTSVGKSIYAGTTNLGKVGGIYSSVNQQGWPVQVVTLIDDKGLPICELAILESARKIKMKSLVGAAVQRIDRLLLTVSEDLLPLDPAYTGQVIEDGETIWWAVKKINPDATAGLQGVSESGASHVKDESYLKVIRHFEKFIAAGNVHIPDLPNGKTNAILVEKEGNQPAVYGHTQTIKGNICVKIYLDKEAMKAGSRERAVYVYDSAKRKLKYDLALSRDASH